MLAQPLERLPLSVERVPGEEGSRRSDDRLELAVRLPWFLSLPLSTLSLKGLSFDGQPVELSMAIYYGQPGKGPPVDNHKATAEMFAVVSQPI